MTTPVRQLLTSESERVETLLGLLEQEQALLAGRDIDGLERLVAAKLECVAGLERCAMEHRGLMSGAQSNSTGLAERAADPAHRRLAAKLARCRWMNSANGGSIELLARFNARLRHALLGGIQTDALYGPGGDRHSLGEPSRYSTSA